MFLAQGKKGAASMKSIMIVIVGIILLIGVAIPITTSVIATANLTGITATIVAFIPTFIGIAGLMLVVTLIAF